MRLSELSKGREKVHFELLIGQFGKLPRKVFVDKFLHVTLVVARNFLAFHSTIEEVTIEFTHHPEAGPIKVAILLHQRRLLARIERQL